MPAHLLFANAIEAAWVLGFCLVLASVISVVLRPLLRRWMPDYFSYDPGLFQVVQAENDEVVILNTRNGSLWKVARANIQDLNVSGSEPKTGSVVNVPEATAKWAERFRK